MNMNEQEIQELYKAFVECFKGIPYKLLGSNKWVIDQKDYKYGGMCIIDLPTFTLEEHLILKAIKQYGIDICWYGRYEDKEDICRVTGYSFEHDKCAFTEAGNDLDLLVMQAVVAINKYEKANAHGKA